MTDDQDAREQDLQRDLAERRAEDAGRYAPMQPAAHQAQRDAEKDAEERAKEYREMMAQRETWRTRVNEYLDESHYQEQLRRENERE